MKKISGYSTLRIYLLTVIIILLAATLGHTRVKYIFIDKMPSMADFVVVGTIIDSSCRWDERGIMIFTDYTILVEDRILGNPGRKIVMSFAGGTVGDKSIFVTDTPQLNVGETYVLFGLFNEKASVPVVGHEQGVFRVLKDKVEGKEYIIDYNGYLLEKLDSGQIIRGPLVDLHVKDRLVIKTQEVEKKVIPPKPIFRDACGQEVPQEGVVFAEPKRRQRGVPVEKSMFIEFIKGRIAAGGKDRK